MSDVIQFFIGSDAKSGCAECQMVLEYSIRKHSSLPVEITWMTISNDPTSFWSGWNTSKWSTPFSGFRYGIAEYCGFKGRAIYQDDDQLWLTDPAELWSHKIPDNKIMTGKQLPNGEVRHCVSLIDCWKYPTFDIPPVSRRKVLPHFCDLMKSLTFPHTEIIDNRFNNYDGEHSKIEDISVLHFTDMSTNPGVKLAIKRLGSQSAHWYDGPIRQHRRPDIEAVFHQYYNEAIEAGYKVENYVSSTSVDYQKLSQKDYAAHNGFDVTENQ